MRTCMQTQGMTVLDHGHSVRSRFVDLVGPRQLEWRLPEWIDHPLVLDSLSRWDDHDLELYQVYHDCGKPLCRTVDGEGRQHFPDHAVTSKARWLECSDGSPAALRVAELIGMDMDAHLVRSAGVAEFVSRPQAVPLLLTALAEVHSNAAMFGGLDSTSFKIKYKHLERLGRRVVEALVAQRQSRDL